MIKIRVIAAILLLAGVAIGYFDYASTRPGARFDFKLGLDLSGGTQLLYQADISNVAAGEVDDSLASIRDVIERRVNLFGVSEPVVAVEGDDRLLVQLPGVTDINRAVEVIGATPYLEFRTENPEATASSTAEEAYLPTELTGRYLKKATLDFGQTSLSPTVLLEFNSEGADLFAKITRENVKKQLAIFLDGAPITAPVVQEEIKTGKAQITGQFTLEQAKTLVGRLNAGALPVPIKLISTESVGASLGGDVLDKSVKAGVWGTLIVALFLIIWYRLPGLLAVVALAVYIILNLAIYKLIPVTLTAAGITGFILSIGMAVDANILIFERMKEEMRRGKSVEGATHEGFARAWLSIRDSNVSSIITAVVLFWLGTSVVKGFALTLGIGVVTSMFTAITVTRLFLYSLSLKDSKILRFLFSNGLTW